jgi:hypothetical protein
MPGLNGDNVELEELDGVGGPIITHADVQPKLVRPDHIALLASESEAPRVVDKLPRNLDVLASFADPVDGAVMIFSVTLEGDACVFQSALDNLTARLSARRRCHTRSCPICWSSLAVPSARGARPRSWVWHSRTQRDPQGRVFVGDGDELSDSSEPPLTAALMRTSLLLIQPLHILMYKDLSLELVLSN